MFTKATFSFEKIKYDKMFKTFYYVDHDAHPKGAVKCLWRMHNKLCEDFVKSIYIQDYVSEYKGNFADIFAKTNRANSELTCGHYGKSGQTNYQYSLDCSGNLIAENREDIPDEFKEFFNDHYCEFINTFGYKMIIEDRDEKDLRFYLRDWRLHQVEKPQPSRCKNSKSKKEIIYLSCNQLKNLVKNIFPLYEKGEFVNGENHYEHFANALSNIIYQSI